MPMNRNVGLHKIVGDVWVVRVIVRKNIAICTQMHHHGVAQVAKTVVSSFFDTRPVFYDEGRF